MNEPDRLAWLWNRHVVQCQTCIETRPECRRGVSLTVQLLRAGHEYARTCLAGVPR